MPSKLPWARLKGIAKKAGGVDNLGTVVDEARRGGPVAGSIADVPKENLPHLDRFAHGAKFKQELGLLGKLPGPAGLDLGTGLAAAGAGAYEAAKFIPPPLWNAAAKAAGRPDYMRDSTTSAPDIENVMSFLKGYLGSE